MAEEQGADVGAGEANGADEQPQLAILAQYVKDLSFENPNAPQVFQSSGQPKLDVNVNVGVTRPGEDVYEVALKINVTAKVESATSFAVRSEEHTSELQSLMRISYAVFCLKKKKHTKKLHTDKLYPDR